MLQRTAKTRGTDTAGFTLVELVLATLISALVVSIFSVALSISLRAWERQQNRQPSDVPALLQLLKWQLAAFEPVQMTIGGRNRVIFEGDGQSLAFATTYSVRAISGGIPVIARYLFNPGQAELYYAELPVDPYHPEVLTRFLNMTPGTGRAWPHFYVTEVVDFSLTYLGKERETMELSADEGGDLPAAVKVACSAKGSSETFTTLMFRNSPFAKLRQQMSGRAANLPHSSRLKEAEE